MAQVYIGSGHGWFIVGDPSLHYSAMLRYVPWDNELEKSRSHE